MAFFINKNYILKMENNKKLYELEAICDLYFQLSHN